MVFKIKLRRANGEDCEIGKKQWQGVERCNDEQNMVQQCLITEQSCVTNFNVYLPPNGANMRLTLAHLVLINK